MQAALDFCPDRRIGMGGECFCGKASERETFLCVCSVELIGQGTFENAQGTGHGALPRAVDRDTRTVYESDPATS